ncbi:MAG: CTP synthase (glutamine hydrolyzing) [Nanoarchaeota archaeon]
MPKTKFIVTTGGVLSGLGKGIATASLGLLLNKTHRIIPIKCDGYLNVDPGTMNPIEHGEVFVLEDGGEVDMDFGHYERFINVNCKFEWNLTMGKVFDRIREKERKGDYLGKTVQFIPHVTDYIVDYFLNVAKQEKADIVTIEIGGTVGDIENELYIESCRQLRSAVGEENIVFVHLTYVPIPSGVHEQKSKPTQQSVMLLRERGVQPDIIIARCSEMLDEGIKDKIAQFCNVSREAVITGLDVENVYRIPIVFDQQGITELIAKKLRITPDRTHVAQWKKLLSNMEQPKHTPTIAICGKYTKLEDSYASVIEAIHHADAHLHSKTNIVWIETTDEKDLAAKLKGVDGVIVPGGFGSRGVEGKIAAVKHCRENNIPYLGLCYGLQMAVIEYARNVAGLKGANTTEVDPKTAHPVVDILPEQRTVTNKGGTMRLGAYPATLKKGTRVHKLYKKTEVSERHRHRYEVNPEYHKRLEESGLVISGMSPNGRLAEFIEIPKHPYFVATQGHPELKSSLLAPAPLFFGLIEASIAHRNKR